MKIWSKWSEIARNLFAIKHKADKYSKHLTTSSSDSMTVCLF